MAEDRTPRVNKLPPEILSSIFLHTRSTRRFQRVLPFQVTLSHICRHWRHVAISTHRLWSSITLFSGDSMPCIRVWLARSAAAPIDVRIDLYLADQAGHVDPAFIEQAFALLVPRAHQFQSLFIFTYHEVNIYHILRLFEHTKAPLLESLCIHTGVHDNARDLAPFIITSDNTINFRSFKGGLPKLFSAELEPLRCIPPLTNITSLRLLGVGRGSSFRFDKLVEILQAPSNLASFSLRGQVDGDSWPIHRDHSHVVLPQLRHLELSVVGTTGPRFLLSIGAPNLESLRWHVTSDSYHLLSESPQFPPRIGKYPLLKYLTLERQPLSPHQLTTFMKIFPTPTHVFFSYPIPQRVRKLSDLVNASPGWAALQVIAVRMFSALYSEQFVPEMKAVLQTRPDIRTIFVDAELLSYLHKTAPDLHDAVELKDLNALEFPEYWRTLGMEDTPDRF